MAYKNYLITGANSHIGQGLVQHLLRDNQNRLLLTSRILYEPFKTVVSDNLQYAPNLDLLNQDDLNSLADRTKSFFNTEFNLIHSVGDFWYHVPFFDKNIVDAKAMMDSHYITLYGVCHSLLPLMIANGGGKILAFSCNSVSHNYPYMAAFTSAKAAVECLIKCIVNEFAMHNIVANSLALSSIQTDPVKESKPFGDYEHFISVQNLCETIEELLGMTHNILNGNTINCFNYSDSFFNEGYFQRNKLK